MLRDLKKHDKVRDEATLATTPEQKPAHVRLMYVILSNISPDILIMWFAKSWVSFF